MLTTISHELIQSDEVKQNEDETRGLTVTLSEAALVIDMLTPAQGPRIWIEWANSAWTIYVHGDEELGPQVILTINDDDRKVVVS